MTEAQIQLQNALTTTFLANMAFLSEYDNELYHKVDELSCMIASGSYKEKYELEFITEDGDFDIYDVINDKYLYNRKPKKINSDLIRKSELDTNNSMFNISEYFFLKEKVKIDRNNRFNFTDVKELTALTLNDMSEYSNLLKDSLEDKKKLKRVSKFIFLGTLLGRHIPKIEKKINADLYLVLERNLEIFRLSLFTTDYSILAKKGVVFSIMDNDQIEKSKIDFFLDKGFFYNYLIKTSSTGINIDKYLDNILTILNFHQVSSYDYNRFLYTYVNRTTNYIKEGYKILLLNKTKESNIFENIPILFIAGGPSLDEKIEWIKNNQNKFFIVTIGAVYKKLLENNINIDIITTVDEQEFLNEIQFDNENISKINKNTIFLASSMTNEKILKKLYSKNLFLYELFSPIYKNNLVVSGFSIGEITLDILLKLNIKELYLIGFDLALNQETGDTHSSSSKSVITNLNLKEIQNRDTFHTRKSLIKVKGNFLEEVFTTPLFFKSIKIAEKILSNKNEDIKVFNLSTNGVFIKGSIPKSIEDIDVTKFSDLYFNAYDFLAFLNKNSLDTLSFDTKNSIKDEIFFLENNILTLLNSVKHKNFINFDEFFKNIFKIYESCFEYKNLNNIIEGYFKIITPYLLYHFNDLKLKNETKKVNKVKEIFTRQIENIILDYISCFKRVN